MLVGNVSDLPVEGRYRVADREGRQGLEAEQLDRPLYESARDKGARRLQFLEPGPEILSLGARDFRTGLSRTANEPKRV